MIKSRATIIAYMTFSLRLAFSLSIRNLSRNKGRNLTLGALIAIGISFLVLGNAIIDTSNAGLQASFINNFTGDLVIAANSEEPSSLFGIDLPVIGELARLPYLESPEKVYNAVLETKLSSSIVQMISSPIVFGVGGLRLKSIAFGVDGKQYFDTFNQFDLIRGSLVNNAANWIVIPEQRALQIEKDLGRTLVIGEEISLNYYSNSSFSIRTGKLAAIVRHHLDNEALLKTVWVGAHTLRDLLGIATVETQTTVPAESNTMLTQSLDDLFMDTGVDLVINDNRSNQLLTDLSNELALAEEARQLQRLHSPFENTASLPSDQWHFILIKIKDGVSPAEARLTIAELLGKRGLAVTIGDWKSAAGATASYILSLKMIFNVGLIILAVVITFILSNALLISIFERTKEIGTIRALGARKSFVKVLLGAEIMFLCFVAGIAGIVLGSIAVMVLNSNGIALENALLINLFGSRSLRPVLELDSLLLSVALSLAIGLISWIVPLQKALKISPLNAIRQES